MRFHAVLSASFLALLLPLPAAPAEGAATITRSDQSPRIAQPDAAPILAVARAGGRSVAVGDHGIVILSDDGTHFRQASSVPTRSTLTSVFFIDGKNGWAVGHDGTVIGSRDGGDSWQVLRQELGKERALFSVWFENAEHGFAVGQFGTALETDDGGRTWRERRLHQGDTGDRHLLHIFAGGGGLVLVAAEAGAIFRSEDNGKAWRMVQTNNKGSFWTGTALSDGTLLAAGMRGHIYRSTDRGLSWKEVPSGTRQSLTAMTQNKDGSVRVVGLSGTVLNSKDRGQSFSVRELPARTNLTAVAGSAGELLFSLSGLVR